MNRRVRSALLEGAARADHEAKQSEREAAMVGEPHHSHIKARAAEWREAAAEFRVLLGLPPDADLLPLLVARDT